MGYPPNRIARLDANKNLHYYFADHLGSERVVQNSTGSACEQDIDYYPYGGVQNDYCPSASQTYKFTGAERDGATGLDALGVRNYSSSLARFMTPDPGHASGLAHPENPQSWNPYSYAVNNPLKFTDTSGFGYCHYKNMSDQQSAEDAKLELGEKQDTPGWCKKHQGEWIYESGETQIVQNNTGSAPIQTPSTEVTVNGVSGEVRYLSFYFQGSDLPIRPEAQIIMRTVGQLTGGYTKQGNCVAGLIYPFTPGVKPEDVDAYFKENAVDAGSDVADSVADSREAAGEAIKNAYTRGAGKSKMRKAVQAANKDARALRVLSWGLKAFSLMSAADDAYDNFMKCELED